MITVTMQLEKDQAWALAQLLKRIGWKEIRINAESEDEAYLMRDAIERARTGLADAGIAPR